MTARAQSLGQTLGARISRRTREWASRRQGPDPRSVCLESNRIYILPTRVGIIFGLIVLTMLLGSMNYSNNMGFALTFLLSGVGVISMHHCHRNLSGLLVHYLGAEPVFAGERMRFRYALENPGSETRWQLRLDCDEGSQICDEVESQGRQTVDISVSTRSRGRIPGPRIKLSTQYPLGLLRAWAWIEMNTLELVYPNPAPPADANLRDDPGQMAVGPEARGDDDFAGLRTYRLGDPPKHIAWKTLARTGQKLVKEYRGGAQNPTWIDWNHCAETETEARLSRLAREVIDADAVNGVYGLRLPNIEVAPGQGPQHRHECLQLLALFGTKS